MTLEEVREIRDNSRATEKNMKERMVLFGLTFEDVKTHKEAYLKKPQYVGDVGYDISTVRIEDLQEGGAVKFIKVIENLRSE